jgi:hypothetical protein
MIPIGTLVKIVRAMDAEETRYVGMTGTLTDIQEHNHDGDFYGITFPTEETLDTIGQTFTVYFWREEFELVV